MMAERDDSGKAPPRAGGGSAYWARQNRALDKARARHGEWFRSRRRSGGDNNGEWMRVTYALPRAEAKKKAREFLTRYPKAAYWSEVESWRELPGDIIEFTLRRLPSAD